MWQGLPGGRARLCQTSDGLSHGMALSTANERLPNSTLSFGFSELRQEPGRQHLARGGLVHVRDLAFGADRDQRVERSFDQAARVLGGGPQFLVSPLPFGNVPRDR